MTSCARDLPGARLTFEFLPLKTIVDLHNLNPNKNLNMENDVTEAYESLKHYRREGSLASALAKASCQLQTTDAARAMASKLAV